MHLVIIGNPENRRVGLFTQAVQQLHLPAPEVISYGDILQGKVQLSSHLRKNTLLRIESPGENFAVEKALIALGAGVADNSEAERITAEKAAQLPYQPGRIRLLRQWYLGYTKLLHTFGQDLAAAEATVQVMNTPGAIGTMFDKKQCRQRLAESGVAVPKSLGDLRTYEALRSALAAQGVKRVFIKPSHGSSASGVIAYRIHQEQETATTSIELVRERGGIQLFNSLKIRTYTSRLDIQAMVDFILREGAIVEEWIPKATWCQKFFDVRVVVIAGKARHVLPRLSTTPITNLHLGNQRGDGQLFVQFLGDEKYCQLLEVAQKAVQSIPGTFYAGVDVLIPAGLGKPRVLEVNAFGDLLPHLLHNGEDTYTAELKAIN